MHINQGIMSRFWCLHDSSAVLQTHSPLVSNTAASRLSSCIWKAGFLQGGSQIQRQLYNMKFPKALSVMLTTKKSQPRDPKAVLSAEQEDTALLKRMRIFQIYTAHSEPVKPEVKKEHSPVWCSPWPSGWRGSASPGKPKHLHSLPYGQQNSLGKPREWWEHVNVTWGYLAQPDLLLVVT